MASDEVHLHWLALAPHLGTAQSLSAVLSHVERSRAARLRASGAGERFTVAHAFARRVLAGYLGVAAPDVPLEADGHGRPRIAIASGLPAPGAAYSLSHSRSHVVVAVAATPWIGVDVEGPRREVDALGVARRYLAAEEATALAELPEASRAGAFARLWACKEAFVKAIGLGLRHALDRFAVAGVEAGRPRLLRLDPAYGTPEEWSLALAAPAIGCFIAVAARLRDPAVRYFTGKLS
jgi:4'-phosphopantetheinyl transferase